VRFQSLSAVIALIISIAFVGPAGAMERIIIDREDTGFITADTKTPFRPWGLNYGHAGRLMEDFWETDWKTLETDFHDMKRTGANAVRVHLQFGKFISSPEQPNRAALERLSQLLKLAEETGLYLDLTGLASYRPSDAPAWYDSMNEKARWATQAIFWEAIAETCKSSPAVFCYDLINEPIVPGQKREAGQWRSGTQLGGYDFVQFITLDPAGRPREDIAVAWIRQMTAAIHRQDTTHLITVGMLPWSREWKHLSGFLPAKVAPELDFLSVHLYPDSKKPGEALEALKQCVVGKPIVIEETFPLSCTSAELESFLFASRHIACGWFGHYDGDSPEALDARVRAKTITLGQTMYREWLRMFVRLEPDFEQIDNAK